MTSQDVAPTTRRPPQIQPRTKKGLVTPKQRVAIKAIVWEGEELDAAAKLAGLTTHALRVALAKPQAVQFMKAEREVFRAYVSGQNIHRAKELRDGAGNGMAKLGAMKFIEQIGDDPAASGGAARSPGMLIVVNAGEVSLNSAGQRLDLRANTGKGVPYGGERAQKEPAGDGDV